MRSFYLGIISKDRKPFLAAFFLFSLILLVGEYIVRGPIFHWVPRKYLMQEQMDDFTAIAHKLGNLDKIPKNRVPVFVLGSSAMREAIFPDHQINQDESIQDFYFIKLSSSSQTLAESLRILELLPKAKGFLVVGLNPVRMSHSKEDFLNEMGRMEVLPKSKRISEILQLGLEYKVSSLFRLNGWISHFRKILSSNKTFILKNFEFPSHEYIEHEYDDRPPLTESGRIWRINKLRQVWFGKFFENYQTNLEVLEVIVNQSKRQGLQPILVELPMNPVVRDEYKEILTTYQKSIKDFSRKNEVGYWEFMWESPIKEEHFYDFSHLLESGRRIFQAELIENLLRRNSAKDLR